MKSTDLLTIVRGACCLAGLLLTNCTDGKDKQAGESSQRTVSRQIFRERVSGKRTSPEMNFLRAKRYKYVTRIAALPPTALAAIENHSQLCDEASERPLNLSDMHMASRQECTKKLIFALIGDAYCLIVYRQGGIGVYDVIQYVHYRGKHFSTTNHAYPINDTVQLAKFLREQPFDVETFTSALTPPPPWPRDSTK